MSRIMLGASMVRLSVNPTITSVRCSKSGQSIPARDFPARLGLCSCCPAPGKPLTLEYDGARVRADWETGRGAGLFRFAAALPVVGVPRDYAADVGGTPVVFHSALSSQLGCDVFLKNESMNPSGSFKDRGLAMGVAFGAARGTRRFCLPTQGNAGVAAALFASRLGLEPTLVFMPDGYQGSIYHRAAEHFGGVVRFGGVNIAAAGKLMRDALQAELASGELVDLSTFFEPGRLEGKKTMGFEIAESFTGEALPDAVFYPTGGGTGLVGIWKAWNELRAWGLAGPAHVTLPRMIAVQSVNCAPVVDAFDAHTADVAPVVSRGTIADGLDVPGAIMGHSMLSVVRESGGFAARVEESAIVDAFAELGRHGIGAGYESAATLAALIAARRDGKIAPGARVLLLLTGSHLIALGRDRERAPSERSQ